MDFIEDKLNCTLEKREWLGGLVDAIGDKLDGPIEDALDEAYDEGFGDGEDSVTEGGE